MKDVFRRGSSLKVYTSAAVSKKCLNHGKVMITYSFKAKIASERIFLQKKLVFTVITMVQI